MGVSHRWGSAAAGAPFGEDAFTADFHPDLIGALVVKGRQDEPLVRLPLGALVMVTDANSFVALPLESNATLTAASALWELNEALGRRTPEPLPPRLLWVRGWAVHDLGAGVVEGQFRAELPRELRAALAQLN